MAIKKFQFLDESGVDTLLSEVKSKTDILYAPKEGTETTKGAQDKADKALADANKYTDEKISEIPTPDVSGQISTHNTSTNSHNDIRLLIEDLTTRLNALANSTDEDLDQMAELVAYIKNNKELIDGITTNKINVDDIINNLT